MKKIFLFIILAFCFVLIAEIQVDKVMQLTDSKIEYKEPKWSPDGTMIAFVRSDYGGLVVMNCDGTNLRHLVKETVHGGRGFVWSEDSEEITFRSGNRYVNTIKILNVKTEEVKSITTSAPWISYPIWQYSEKGKRAAWVNGNGKLFYSDYKPFKNVKYNDVYKKHNYDKNVIYAGGWSKNSKKKYIIIDNEGRIKKDINLEKYMADWSPDRTKIAYKYNGYIYTVNPDGTNLKQLCQGELWSWDKNSKKILYNISEDDGHNYSASDLFIIDIDGKNKIQLTDTTDEIEFYPDWSPDGNKIVYSSLKTGNLYLIYLIDK